MIVDLSSSNISAVKSIEQQSDATKYSVDYTAASRRIVSFDEYIALKDALSEVVLTGDKEERRLKRLAIEEEANSLERSERYCDRCGKKFYAKPWNELGGQSCILCDECDAELTLHVAERMLPMVITPWKQFALDIQDSTSRISDEIIRNY